jgi:hypothetical protein
MAVGSISQVCHRLKAIIFSYSRSCLWTDKDSARLDGHGRTLIQCGIRQITDEQVLQPDRHPPPAPKGVATWTSPGTQGGGQMAVQAYKNAQGQPATDGRAKSIVAPFGLEPNAPNAKAPIVEGWGNEGKAAGSFSDSSQRYPGSVRAISASIVTALIARLARRVC